MSEQMKTAESLQMELEELRKQQSDALKQATYFPMTLEESKEFDERANLIDKLHRQLMKFEATE